jgi:hypothetical protein
MKCLRLRAFYNEPEKKSGSKRCLYQQLCQLFLRRQVASEAEAVLLYCCITVGKMPELANGVLRLAVTGVVLSVSELPS